MWKRLVWVVTALVLLAGDSRADDSETIQASVDSISEADLGRPYTEKFAPVTGKDGRSLFPSAKAARRSQVNTWAAGFIDVEDTRVLRANATAWGIAEGSFSATAQYRYLVYRVRVIEHTLEVDDTTEQRPLEIGSTAVYYVRKIHFGRIYQIVISGSRDVLSGKIALGIKSLGASLGAEHVRSNYKLSVFHSGKGLKPTSDAVFATTPDEIKAAYKDKDMGPPVPILVEYRRIPGTKIEPPETIDWGPPAVATSRLQIRTLKVAGNNSDWTTTGISIGPKGLVAGVAIGAVSYSKWNPSVEASASGSGGLEMRAGTTIFPAGKSWMLDVGDAAGEVKLRVRDNDHKDNKGFYEVKIYVVPEDVVKTGECQKQDEQGAYADCPWFP